MWSCELIERTEKLSEYAYALCLEAATLTRLARENPAPVPLPVVLLLRKALEVCKAAEVVRKMAQGQPTRSRKPWREARQRAQKKTSALWADAGAESDRQR
jgi:hypothetical protein